MKTKIINIIVTVLGVISSIITIATFICVDLGIEIPKINIENICLNYGIYILPVSFIFIIFSLLNARYKTKVYNTKLAENYGKIIDSFKYIIVHDEKMTWWNWLQISNLIKDIYPYKNKTKLNLYFQQNEGKVMLFDTSNYNDWHNKATKKYFRARQHRGLPIIDWRAQQKYFDKREIDLYIGSKDCSVVLHIYGDCKLAFTKRKKKKIQKLIKFLDVFIYIVFAQKKVDTSVDATSSIFEKIGV